MPETIAAPEPWVASIGALTLPKRADRRLGELMDRNHEGVLTAGEREELESLVEWSEEISLLRAEALQLLGRQPPLTRAEGAEVRGKPGAWEEDWNAPGMELYDEH